MMIMTVVVVMMVMVVADAVCRLLRDGVAAVFGPTVAETSRHVEAVCEAVEMPHFRAHWDLDAAAADDEVDGNSARTGRKADDGDGLYSVSVHPPYADVGRSVVDFIRAHDWKSFAVLYDSDDGT